MSPIPVVHTFYFAACRARTGIGSEDIPELVGMRIQDAVVFLGERHPQLAPILSHCRMARNQSFADKEEVLCAGDEIALIPPVAGGAPAVDTDLSAHILPRVSVLDAPLSADVAIRAVSHAGAGAVVVMIGMVRDHAAGETVTRLEYEAYIPMAVKVMSTILDEIEQQYTGIRTSIQHRVGDLQIGDWAVVVAVSSPHRQDAFAACALIIDNLKKDAPIWKREHRGNGVVWVGLGP